MSDRFHADRTLGEGAFGKVYLVTDRIDGGKQYAMKVIDLRTSPQDEKDLALKEANLLRTLKHEHVLSYTDSFENGGALCIVTEYCSNGDLSVYLEKRGGRKLEEDRLIDWFREILSALKYLHGKKIIHRDIKTPNIFLTQTWTTKLGDLGLAKVLERPNAKAVTFCGSPYYMSPEIFSCKPYDTKSDIWALGVIVYEMATLERPFDAMLMHQLVFKIVHGGLPKMPDGYTPELSDALSKMMQKDTDLRPTAADLLDHKLFQGKTKPKPMLPPPPQPKVGAAGCRNRWAAVIQRKDEPTGKNPGAGPFDMNTLLDSLSVARQKGDKAKGGARPKERPKGGGAAVGLDSIMAKTYKDEDMDKTLVDKSDKLKTFIGPKSVVSVSDVGFTTTSSGSSESGDDMSSTLKASGVQAERDAFNVMQLVVRTLTGVFHGVPDDKPDRFGHDPNGMLLRQIEQLQFFCIKVLGNDMKLFQRAYDMLGTEKDENKLEEKLIEILGHERFGLCGVQFMYLKNFEYNLNKLTVKKK